MLCHPYEYRYDSWEKTRCFVPVFLSFPPKFSESHFTFLKKTLISLIRRASLWCPCVFETLSVMYLDFISPVLIAGVLNLGRIPKGQKHIPGPSTESTPFVQTWQQRMKYQLLQTYAGHLEALLILRCGMGICVFRR